MATTTPNLGLVKPDYEDLADVAVINENSDTIDAAVKAVQDRVSEKTKLYVYTSTASGITINPGGVAYLGIPTQGKTPISATINTDGMSGYATLVPSCPIKNGGSWFIRCYNQATQTTLTGSITVTSYCI